MKIQIGGTAFSKKRATSYIPFGVFFLLLIGCWLALTSAQPVISSPVVVVTGGDPSPIGGVFGTDGTPAIGLGVSQPTDGGGVVFYASISEGSAPQGQDRQRDQQAQGVFRVVGNSLSKIVAVGDLTPIGGKFSALFPPSANQVGDIAFGALVDDGTAPQGLFLVSGGHMTTIATLTNDTLLGEDLPMSPALNNNGEIVFKAPLAGEKTRLGIFKAAGGRTSKVVEDGDETPFEDLSSFTVQDPSPVLLNDAGDVVFSSWPGIFLSSQTGKITKVVAHGDPTPLGGTFEAFNVPTFNNRREVAFMATVNTPEGDLLQAIFLASAGVLTPIVVAGDPAPIGGAFAVLDAQRLNDRGEIVFSAVTTGKPTIGGLFPAAGGIFLFSHGRISKIVAVGDLSPLGGVFLNGLGPGVLSDTGTVLFPGIIDTDGDGNPNNQGLFAVTVSGF